MSGTPKRSHEEASSTYPHEDASPYPKVTSSSVSNDYHRSPAYESGQDSRTAKIQRTESRDLDRRSPLHLNYRVPSSVSNDAHIHSHPTGSDSRVESRDLKGAREVRAESREPRAELREFHGDAAKREHQSVKGEKEVRLENKGEEGKEMKFEKENSSDPKGDLKVGKDVYGGSSNQLSWKDSREYLRVKRHSESPGGGMDPLQMPRGNTQGQTEVGKEGSTTEERNRVEAHEAVGQNKFDPKSEARFIDKERKRNDGWHRDWGDKDKERSDCRSSSILVGNNSVEGKDSAKEGRDTERLEREKKDLKEKERLKEEKDHVKKEPSNGTEKDSEKEGGDKSVTKQEHENTTSEQRKQRDLDNWKNVERESKEKRRERDVEIEGDKSEKHSRAYEKESDDGTADVEGTPERERDALNYGVQQHKRLLRPRGSPQIANRELRFRSRSQENEGSQGKLWFNAFRFSPIIRLFKERNDFFSMAFILGKAEVSSVVYKVGECMQDLIKLWKEYEAPQADKSSDSSQNGPTLQIRIPAEYVTATNRQVRGGQLWGTDIYTDDSDLVAVLMHTGYCRPTASPPPPAIQELRATIRVLPPQDCYTSKLRNNVRSRGWGAGIGCSYRVERCCIVKKGGGTIDLEPCLTHSSTVEPTLAPVAVERTMTTRSAASNALRQQRFVREVTIQYNLCNEPWIKYSISIVADKGLKKPLYTSARLKKGEVLYLETHSCRYELSFSGEKLVKNTTASQTQETETEKPQNHHSHSVNGEKNDPDNILTDVFRWSRCKKPLPQKVMRCIGIPLSLEHVEVIAENLDWEEVQWSQTGVWIAGKEYTLARVHFLSGN